MPDIQYPFAYSRPYDLIAVGQASRGTEYLCINCDGPMIPKALASEKMRPHFAHKADACAGDTALHRIAQAMICDAFMSAIEGGREYLATTPCPKCEQHSMEPTNIARQGWRVAAEKTVVDGTRSDIVMFNAEGKPALIIEVVVTSDFEKKEVTDRLYRNSGVPILKVRPDWETLPALREAIRADKLVNAKPSYQCQTCRELDEQRRRWEGQHNRFREFAKSVVDKIKLQSSASRLVPITHDRYGSPLQRQTRDAVTHNASLLVRLGFTQQPSRPTLFRFQEGDWKIFADLDSTRVMPIWEADCAAALYTFPKSRPFRACMLALVTKKLSEHGVATRRHFEDRDYCRLCENDGYAPTEWIGGQGHRSTGSG